MSEDSLDFSFDMSSVDRDALLVEAAKRIDALGGHLGVSDGSDQRTPEGDLVRKLKDDIVKFSFPDVYEITNQNFITRNLSVPVPFQRLTQAFRFYWLYFPVSLFPQYNWGFNRLEVLIEFNPGESEERLKPKTYEILPAKKFETRLEAKGQLEVCLDENFEFSAETDTISARYGPVSGKVGAGVDAKVAGKLGLEVGPFVYRIKKAKIDHTPVGMELVRWRIDGAQFFQDDETPLIAIIKVPRETKEVKIVALLQAYRYFSFANAGLQEAVRELPAALQRFFTGGLPAVGQASWDISPML